MAGTPSGAVLRTARSTFVGIAVLAGVLAVIVVRLMYARSADATYMNFAAGSRMVTERIARLAVSPPEGTATDRIAELHRSAAELRTRAATLDLAAPAPLNRYLDAANAFGVDERTDRAARATIVRERGPVIALLEDTLSMRTTALNDATRIAALSVLGSYAALMVGAFLILRLLVRPLALRLDASERDRSFLALAISQASDMVFVAAGTDLASLRMTFTNEAMERELGYARHALLNQSPAIAYGPRTDKATVAAIFTNIQAGREAGGEFLCYRKDGSTFWSEWRGRPIAVAAGSPHTWIAIGRNTDERRRSEEALAMLSAAVDSATDAIFIYSMRDDDPAPVLRYLNQAGTIVSGIRLSDAESATTRIDPRMGDGIVKEIVGAMRQGKSWHKRSRLTHTNGTSYWSDINLKPLRDRSGQFTQWISIERDVSLDVERESRLEDEREAMAVLVDVAGSLVQTMDAAELTRLRDVAVRDPHVTARPEAQRLLESMYVTALQNVKLYQDISAGRDALQQSEGLRKSLMLMIAHDIRSPLTGLLGFGQLITDGLIGPEEISETVQSMIVSGKRLESLADELSMFAQLESGDYEPNYERLDANAIVDDVRAYVPGGARIVVSPAADGSLETDRIALRHIVENLLGNALKYSPAHTQIDVAIGRDDDQLILRVTDHGIGIPAADLEHVFERRSRASNAGAINGTGLGLSFVRRLVGACRGTIDVRSVVDAGSTFTVRLPLRSGTYQASGPI